MSVLAMHREYGHVRMLELQLGLVKIQTCPYSRYIANTDMSVNSNKYGK